MLSTLWWLFGYDTTKTVKTNEEILSFEVGSRGELVVEGQEMLSPLAKVVAEAACKRMKRLQMDHGFLKFRHYKEIGKIDPPDPFEQCLSVKRFQTNNLVSTQYFFLDVSKLLTSSTLIDKVVLKIQPREYIYCPAKTLRDLFRWGDTSLWINKKRIEWIYQEDRDKGIDNVVIKEIMHAPQCLYVIRQYFNKDLKSFECMVMILNQALRNNLMYHIQSEFLHFWDKALFTKSLKESVHLEISSKSKIMTLKMSAMMNNYVDSNGNLCSSKSSRGFGDFFANTTIDLELQTARVYTFIRIDPLSFQETNLEPAL